MNTPELLPKLNKSISRIARALRGFAELIFGNISWRPPGWLSRSVAGCSRFGRAHPRLIASGVIAILLISVRRRVDLEVVFASAETEKSFGQDRSS